MVEHAHIREVKDLMRSARVLPSFRDFCSQRMAEHSFTYAQVAKQSSLNPTYTYQIMNELRRARRDNLIKLAFGLQLSFDDTCQFLYLGGVHTCANV